MPTYYDSAEGITITKARALRELSMHGIDDPQDFFAEVGDCEIYSAQAVLEWLGY